MHVIGVNEQPVGSRSELFGCVRRAGREFTVDVRARVAHDAVWPTKLARVVGSWRMGTMIATEPISVCIPTAPATAEGLSRLSAVAGTVLAGSFSCQKLTEKVAAGRPCLLLTNAASATRIQVFLGPCQLGTAECLRRRLGPVSKPARWPSLATDCGTHQLVSHLSRVVKALVCQWAVAGCTGVWPGCAPALDALCVAYVAAAVRGQGGCGGDSMAALMEGFLRWLHELRFASVVVDVASQSLLDTGDDQHGVMVKDAASGCQLIDDQAAFGRMATFCGRAAALLRLPGASLDMLLTSKLPFQAANSEP
eukprot:TRINITY_DN13550_c0_g1_i1.p1 TRINITY_DN13550_c0_g1~~TRINITY_DN13550_c0_g1_i1.p1  ORF type:complete len:309 (+),score=49.44 TRINITY_DN13550_c0_g1_i1:557-1483(+)